MRIAIIGGHLAPALAVIDELPRETQILFIGRKHTLEGDRVTSLEYNTIKSLKIPFASISTGRLQRKFTKYTFSSLSKIPYGLIQAFFILRSFKPDVVLSFGGYLSLPVVLCSYLMRIPVVIHEQTFEGGLANRITSLFAKKICISWQSSRKFFPREKTVFTGNAIRKFSLSSRLKWRDLSQQALLKEIPRQARNDTPIIYVTGGSSGSHFINTLVEGSIKELLKQFVIIHQTGDSKEYKDFDRLKNLRQGLSSLLKSRYILEKFISPYNIGSVLRKADLVVGRSGINTVTELIYFAKPAILIPIAFAQNNEQLKNALFFKSLGLGEVLNQKSLDTDRFLQKVKEMVNNISRYKIRDYFEPFVKHHSGNQPKPKHPEYPAKSDSGQTRMTNFENAAKKIVKVVEYVAKKKKT